MLFFFLTNNPDIKQNIFNKIILIINVSWAANQHITMISEGSRDTEDWSNDAENSAWQHWNIIPTF